MSLILALFWTAAIPSTNASQLRRFVPRRTPLSDRYGALELPAIVDKPQGDGRYVGDGRPWREVVFEAAKAAGQPLLARGLRFTRSATPGITSETGLFFPNGAEVPFARTDFRGAKLRDLASWRWVELDGVVHSMGPASFGDNVVAAREWILGGLGAMATLAPVQSRISMFETQFAKSNARGVPILGTRDVAPSRWRHGGE